MPAEEKIKGLMQDTFGRASSQEPVKFERITMVAILAITAVAITAVVSKAL